MSARSYTLMIKTSRKSATAFSLRARCDEDAVGQAFRVLKKVAAFWDRPAFEVMRSDGTIVQTMTYREQPA